jgi:hypothetical protein
VNTRGSSVADGKVEKRLLGDQEVHILLLLVIAPMVPVAPAPILPITNVFVIILAAVADILTAVLLREVGQLSLLLESLWAAIRHESSIK